MYDCLTTDLELCTSFSTAVALPPPSFVTTRTRTAAHRRCSRRLAFCTCLWFMLRPSRSTPPLACAILRAAAAPELCPRGRRRRRRPLRRRRRPPHHGAATATAELLAARHVLPVGAPHWRTQATHALVLRVYCDRAPCYQLPCTPSGGPGTMFPTGVPRGDRASVLCCQLPRWGAVFPTAASSVNCPKDPRYRKLRAGMASHRTWRSWPRSAPSFAQRWQRAVHRLLKEA